MATTTIHTTIDQYTRVMGALLIEASDLGLPPGQWPAVIIVANERGACERFYRNRVLLAEEGGWVYANPYVLEELHVFND